MAEPEAQIPRNIGGDEIIEILGEGGMSVVYTAMQEHPRRKVAIKVLRGGIFSPTAARRFHLEVEILGKLDHPWIAKVFDAGTHDDGNGATPFFVMEYVSGAKELTPYLKEESPERREILKLFAMISSAIEHGHHRGVVHRDLKPGNILIDENGEPKIIDFGVARSLDNTVGEEAMTEAGRLVGTVQFMAPEQVDPKIKDIDARCDVYALGVVLYQMLTDRLPRVLEGLPIYEAVRQICEEDPVRPTIHDKTIDTNIEAIIMKAIHHNRERRYQSAGAMGRDMLRYLSHQPIKARKISMIDRAKLFLHRHGSSIGIASIVSVVVISIISMFIYKQGVGDSEIKRLESEIAELKTPFETTPVVPLSTQKPEPIEAVLTLPENAESVFVSGNGKIIVAIKDEFIYSRRTNDALVHTPPMNVDLSKASLALSQNGETLGVVAGVKCRIAQLGTFFEGDSEVVGRFTTTNSPPVAIAVDATRLAIVRDNMTLELFEIGEKTKRSASMSGQYVCIALPNLTQVVAATQNKVFVWTDDFPNNAMEYEGVQDPIVVGMMHEKPVIIGRGGDLIYYTNKLLNRKSLDLAGDVLFASVSSSGKKIAIVVGATLLRYDISTGDLRQVNECSEEIGGVSINSEGVIVFWTRGGEVFELTE